MQATTSWRDWRRCGRRCEAAETEGLASAWLLFQLDKHQIGIVTVAAKVAGTDDADNASRSLAALEHSESLARYHRRNLLRTTSSTAPASTCPCGYPGPARRRRPVGLPNLPRAPAAVDGATRIRSRRIHSHRAYLYRALRRFIGWLGFAGFEMVPVSDVSCSARLNRSWLG